MCPVLRLGCTDGPLHDVFCPYAYARSGGGSVTRPFVWDLLACRTQRKGSPPTAKLATSGRRRAGAHHRPRWPNCPWCRMSGDRWCCHLGASSARTRALETAATSACCLTCRSRQVGGGVLVAGVKDVGSQVPLWWVVGRHHLTTFSGSRRHCARGNCKTVLASSEWLYLPERIPLCSTTSTVFE